MNPTDQYKFSMQQALYKMSLVIVMLFMSVQVQAQFYDTADQIRFYQDVGGGGGVWIINFDGYNATKWWDSSEDKRTLIKRLVKNENYYEQKLYETPYNLKYEPEKSTGSKVVYSYKLYLEYATLTKYMEFSADGDYLCTEHKKYKRVPKETFIRKRRR